MTTDPRILPAAKALYAHPISNGSGTNAPEIIAQCESAAAVMLSAIDHATTITTREEFIALPNNSVIEDIAGSVGIIYNGNLWNPEASEVDLELAADIYLPAIVRHRGTE